MADIAEETANIIIRAPQTILESAQMFMQFIEKSIEAIRGAANVGVSAVQGTAHLALAAKGAAAKAIDQNAGRAALKVLKAGDGEVAMAHMPEALIHSVQSSLEGQQVRFAVGKDRVTGDALLYFSAKDTQTINEVLEQVVEEQAPERKADSRQTIAGEMREAGRARAADEAARSHRQARQPLPRENMAKGPR